MSEEHPAGQGAEPAADPGPLPGQAGLDAALGGLDRATRGFTEQLRRLGGHEPDPVGGGPDTGSPRASGEEAFALRMREAEREAREYLERAKLRADSLVASMVGAVEQEAEEIRRDAEHSIRERWGRLEVEAGRYLEDAEQVAKGMVAERQQRISALSDGICDRAERLTGGMDDAELVRRQFDSFVRALSETAGRIAGEHGAGADPAAPVAPFNRPLGGRGSDALAA